MKFLREFSYNFIDVDIFSSSSSIPRNLKLITLSFLAKKYNEGTKTVKI